MNRDTIEVYKNSLIQHGKVNNRIYLLKIENTDMEALIPGLDELAKEKGYSKIFGKIRPFFLPCFILNGYKIEAFIPGYFCGKEDCIIVSKFLDKNRAVADKAELAAFFKLRNQERNNPGVSQFAGCRNNFMKLLPEDARAISEVFKKIFISYPFPVHDPAYIIRNMESNKLIYFGVKEEGKLIGVSAAETDKAEKNAEMTDFAVLPQYRGRGLAGQLLSYMEETMKPAGVKTLYTIARLREPGINKIFINAGYRYTGTLINNTNISGSIESMNIFYKNI